MNPEPCHPVAGLHPADLTASEQAELAQLIARDPEAAEEARFARELVEVLGTEAVGGPTVAQIRQRAAAGKPQSWRPLGGGLLALAAAALLFAVNPLGAGDTGGRDKGSGVEAPVVGLSVVAEGPDGVRPVAPGGRLAAGEQVVFWVDASVAGTLTLTEDGHTVVYPKAGQWQAKPGRQALGGSAPLAWRPDRGGSHRYSVELCTAGGRCATQDLVLEWPTE